MLEISDAVRITDVQARDAQIQASTLRELTAKKDAVETEKARRSSLASGVGYKSQFCVSCCATFSWPFKRSNQCASCRLLVCKECVLPMLSGDLPECRLCLQERSTSKRMRAWIKLYPYKSGIFGFQKLLVELPPEDIAKDALNFWRLCACVESLVESQLQIQLLPASIDYRYNDVCIEPIENKLRKAIKRVFSISSKETSPSLPDLFASVQHDLHEPFAELLRQINDLSKTEKEFEKVSIVVNSEVVNYPDLLALAVTNQSVERIKIEKSMPIQTASKSCEDGESPMQPESANSEDSEPIRMSVDEGEEEVRNQAANHMLSHRVSLPEFDPEDSLDVDSALEINDPESRSSSVSKKTNWFLKDSISPPGTFSKAPRSIVNLFHESVTLPYEEKTPDPGFTDEVEDFNEDWNEAASASSGPRFLRELQSTVALSGERVRFCVQVSGAEPLDICWYNENRQLHDQGRYRIYSRKGQHYLEIYDVNVVDAGEIACVAVNEVTVTTSVAQLIVHDQDLAGEEPVFLEPLESTQLELGQPLKLLCRVSGRPEPRVSFYWNDQPVISSESSKIDDCGGGLWGLYIDATSMADVGDYIAVALNRFGRVTCRARVSLLAASRTCSPQPRTQGLSPDYHLRPQLSPRPKRRSPVPNNKNAIF